MLWSRDSIFTPPPRSAAGSVVFDAVGKLEKEAPVVAQSRTQPAAPKPLPEAASAALPARGCRHASAVCIRAFPCTQHGSASGWVSLFSAVSPDLLPFAARPPRLGETLRLLPLALPQKQM